MKTIEERAKEWIDSLGAGLVHPYNRQAMIDAYIAGAKAQEIIHKKNIRLEMGDSDVWLSLDDFEEFIQECTRLAVKLKESKKK